MRHWLPQGHRQTVVFEEEGRIVQLRLVAHTGVPLAIVAHKQHLRAHAQRITLIARISLQTSHKQQQRHYNPLDSHFLPLISSHAFSQYLHHLVARQRTVAHRQYQHRVGHLLEVLFCDTQLPGVQHHTYLFHPAFEAG